jgi:hypothetical protein
LICHHCAVDRSGVPTAGRYAVCAAQIEPFRYTQFAMRLSSVSIFEFEPNYGAKFVSGAESCHPFAVFGNATPVVSTSDPTEPVMVLMRSVPAGPFQSRTRYSVGSVLSWVTAG